MKKALITIARERGHFRIEVYIDGQIEPTTVFGCREGIEPILDSLGSGERYKRTVGATSEPDTITPPATIAVRLPSGRYIAYGCVVAQDPFPDGP
jgi:hypothetical protein